MATPPQVIEITAGLGPDVRGGGIEAARHPGKTGSAFAEVAVNGATHVCPGILPLKYDRFG
jgi:hypothetical protein